MSRQISIRHILEAIHDGYKNAQTQYEEWTGGEWLWNAPEYLITTSVAQSLFSIDGAKYLTLENAAKSTIKEAGARGTGILPQKLRADGRVDILLWRGDGSPRAIIEIKNQIYSTQQYKKDIERISEFLKRKSDDSTIQFGVFSFYESANDGKVKTAERKILDRIEKILCHSESYAGNSISVTKTISDIFEDGKGSAWASVCLLLKKI